MAILGIVRQITARLSSTVLRDQAQNRPAGGRFPWQASDGRRRTPGRGRNAYREAVTTVRRSLRLRPPLPTPTDAR